jgi:2,3-bisphosphoglycerate-independent phosphoglycerate mutase
VVTRLLVLVPDGGAGVAGARTPATDALPWGRPLATVPAGAPVRSEVALPSFLGLRPSSVPARGAVEAASLGVMLPAGAAAWRLDLGDPLPGDDDPAVIAARLGRAVGGDVYHLRRGRFLLVGPDRWLTHGRDDDRIAAVERAVGGAPRLWGGGRTAVWPRVACPTAVVCATTGAAAGVARLAGADVMHPAGATGFPGTDLAAKVAAATALLDAGEHTIVLVHVGAVDEAGHARDADGQRRELESFDRTVVAGLAPVAAELDVAVLVAPDHGTDPSTGAHVAGPVRARASVPLAGDDVRDVVRQLTAREVAA